MENKQDSNKPKIHITVTGIIAWVLGVSSSLAGVMYFLSNPLVGVLYILVGLILVPPAINTIQDKFNFHLSRGTKIIAVLVLFVIIGMNVDNTGSLSMDSIGNSSDIDTGEQDTSNTPKEYVEVFSFSGNGTKKSEPFNIVGDRFKIAYKCSGDSMATFCGAFVYKVGSSFPQSVMNSTEAISDETIIYTSMAGKGEYYIDASVIGNFSMTVYDYK